MPSILTCDIRLCLGDTETLGNCNKIIVFLAKFGVRSIRIECNTNSLGISNAAL